MYTLESNNERYTWSLTHLFLYLLIGTTGTCYHVGKRHFFLKKEKIHMYYPVILEKYNGDSMNLVAYFVPFTRGRLTSLNIYLFIYFLMQYIQAFYNFV